jgi:acyl-CoA synthetase (AMP-forming)/AMP-acid ligase II
MPTLAQILREQRDTNPDRIAVFLQHAGQADHPISRSQLFSQANSYAAIYAGHGIQPAEVVVLILEHGEPLVGSFFGAILGGQIPAIMPFLTEKLTPERYRADLSDLIKITQPAAIVTSPELEPEIRQAVTDGSSVRAVILTSEMENSPDTSFETLAGLTCKPESIALLQHSSGTTGLQKGVALSHTALLNQLEAYRRAIRINSDDVVVSWLPLYHDMGLIAGFLLPILTGLPLVLMSPFDWVRAPQRLFQAISDYRGSLTWLPNFAYNFCAHKIRERHMIGLDLSSWRAVVNCSEPVKLESHKLFFEKFQAYGLKSSALQTSYAMAENVFGVTQSDLDRGPALEQIDQQAFLHEHLVRPALPDKPCLQMMSSGRPLTNTEIRIQNTRGQLLPERQIGEVALRSNSMLTGYFHRPDLTEKSLREGWYLTGDLGYISDSELFVTGRKKDLIIVGGKNIYPQDIEMLVNQVPGVHAGRAVVFGVFDENQGTEDVIVVAEVDDISPQGSQTISDEIRQHVAKNSAVVLRSVHLVAPKWLLKTSSGKIARSANREKYLSEIE